jgi:hypothetical protein
VASFPRSRLFSRTPKISLIRFAVSLHRPISQLRIPMKPISQSDLMSISAERSDAGPF